MNIANRRRNLESDNRYVYVSCQANGHGYVAVIDSGLNKVTRWIPVGNKPGPMCMDPAEKKLYVVNTDSDSVTVINTDTFTSTKTINVGNPFKRTFPNAIFASAKGNKVYVSHSTNKRVTIIDSLKDEVIETLPIPIPGDGLNFAFAGNKNSNFVYLACTMIDAKEDRVFAIDIEHNVVYPYGTGMDISFDGFHNPFAVHPDGHTQATFGFYGSLTYFEGSEVGKTRVTELLKETVSGVYLDSRVLVCTMRDDLDFLAVIKNLTIDKSGSVSYEDFDRFPSYQWQDKIRLSRTQAYIGVTIRPFGPYKSGVQIIHSQEGTSKLVELPFVGDLAFAGDTKAYVGEENTVRPIDLATGTAQTAIPMGAGVANIISGYINRSL